MGRNSLKTIIQLLLVICLFVPAGAMAYSYGDPNKEDVAESFKEIVVELSRTPIDWLKAEAIYKTRRAEISSHFGEDVAVTLDLNLSEQDKEMFIANYKAVLVLNLERRFTFAIKDFGEYADVKLLVAKAKGTYDVLKPYIPADKTDDLDLAFNEAYDALGNPGLFGVGEKPSDEAVFKEQTAFILNAVRPLFPYTKKSVVVEEKETTKPEQTTSAPAKEEPVAEAPEVEETNTTPTDEPVANVEAEQPTASIDAGETELPQEEQVVEAADSINNLNQETEAEHAPMERTKKTNPLVSIIVISAILLIAGTTLWILRRKKLI